MKNELGIVEAPSLDDLKKVYGMEDVMKLLGSLPNSMYHAELKLMQAEKDLALAKFELKQKTAQAHLRARNDSSLSSADDRKAYAVIDPKVTEAEFTVIEADVELTKTKLIFNRLERLFVAARKLASMIIEADDHSDNIRKYETNA